MANDSKHDIKISVLAENNAQNVYKHLSVLESNRAQFLSRWIWELLQNARDASIEDGQLVASVERRSNDITFLHNGRGFREKEITHLILSGSTKADDDASLGQFGSGFITTHLLSSEIEVAGDLCDGRSFDFKLTRQAASPETLEQSMESALNSFAPSLTPLMDPLPQGFSTRFRYPITTEEAGRVVSEGIETLTACAPAVLAFNPQFQRICISDVASVIEFAVTDRRSFPDAAVAEVTVVKSHDGSKTEARYLLVEGGGTTVAMQVETNNHRTRCVSHVGPRLYLGFPLVGTDQFSLPSVANSFQFGPTENRDGVYLGQADNNETNRVNQQLVEAAFALHIELIRFAANGGYVDAAALAVVPPIEKKDWLNDDWLRHAVQGKLIEPIRGTPCVMTDRDGPLAPKNAVLPYANDEQQVLELRRLLAGVKGISMLLPSSSEAGSWCDAVGSWASINGNLAVFGEAWDGRRFAEYINSETRDSDENCGTLDNLRALLVDEEDAVSWLDRVCGFLLSNGFSDTLSTLNLVLNQAGFLDRLPNLCRDCGIDDELKQIADDLLGLKLREKLRDVRITSLREERGAGDQGNTEVGRRILEKLRVRTRDGAVEAEKPREASVRLLAWMVLNGRIDDVEHFPVWSEAHHDEEPEIIWFERNRTEGVELPLAPIRTWPAELRDFADLFPRGRILADRYFDRLPELDHWKRIEDIGLLKTDVIIRRQENLDFEELPPEVPLPEGDHRSKCQVEVVDVTYFVKDRIGIMSRVPDSPKRAVLLWRFLTEYMIPIDRNSLGEVAAECECGETHTYYGAAWLGPLARNKWVPLGGNKRSVATAHSLAALLTEDGPSREALARNEDALRLLRALGVTELELTMEFLAGSEEAKRGLGAELARILTSTDGDLMPVSRFVEDLQSDDGLLDHLNERRERRRSVHRNQKLGAIVECLVKESLEAEGFDVQRTGIGSDYEIEHDALDEAGDEEMGIELASEDGRKWLVEIKATEGDEVRMTQTQAKTAIERRDEFLLCVVAVSVEPADLDVDQVRVAMRFVTGIGEHLGSLCSDLDDVEEMRQAATENDSAYGVRLEILRGKARICVEGALWRDAIPLDGLVAALGHSAG